MRHNINNSIIISSFIILFAGSIMAVDLEKTYEFADIHSINIKAMTGEINIHSGDGDKIIFHYINKMEKPDIISLDIDSARGELFIEEKCDVKDPVGHTTLDITIPQNLIVEMIDCFSGYQSIEIHDVDADFIKCHAATGSIAIGSVKSTEMDLTTSSGPINLENCEIKEYANMVSSGGHILIELPYLPSKKTNTASTTADTYLAVEDFGDNFKLTIIKNEDEGHILIPFKCTESYTERYHKEDTFKSDFCVVKMGRGGPEINMITGYGKININEGKASRE
nr:DUF4097 family beta strand repeat protein [candidate division Zixibacteria bacterium]